MSALSDRMLRQFGPRIWTSKGPIISFLGFRYPTRMAVINLSRGRIVHLVTHCAFTGTQAGSGRIRIGELHSGAQPAPSSVSGEWASAYPRARALRIPGFARKASDP